MGKQQQSGVKPEQYHAVTPEELQRELQSLELLSRGYFGREYGNYTSQPQESLEITPQLFQIKDSDALAVAMCAPN
jgi:hypothetical protein